MNSSSILSKFIQPGKAFIFSKSYCPYCDMAKDLFKNLGVPYESIEVDSRSDIFTEDIVSTFHKDSNGGVFLLDNKDYELGVKKLDPNAKLPVKAHPTDLAYDLFALEDVTLAPNCVTKVRTGIACKFPMGYGAVIKDRSSVATKQELFTVAGVIDNGYTGEISVAFYNPSVEANPVYANRYFKAGDKIAQMILTPVVTVSVYEIEGDMPVTDRGDKGYGSTGT
jgi:deoxyuridine 5'-triphosphate nucleotidohydrolase